MVEALGIGLPGNAAYPAVDGRRNVLARDAGRRIVQMVKDDLKPSDVLVKEAFENAIRTGQQDGSIAPDIAAHKSALIVFSMADSMVRFRMNNLYDVRSLYKELVDSCRRMLEKRTQ